MAAVYDDNSNIYDNNLETCALFWLDAAVNTSEENREAQQQIRSTINHVTTFEDANLCQRYIQSIPVHDRLVLIVSGRLGQEVVPHIHHMRQLLSIYVYCMDKERNEKWTNNFAKVKAVTIQLDDLICRIKADQKKRGKEEDPIVINIITVSQNPDQSTTGMNGSFVHSLLLIDVLLRMKSSEKDKQELIELCKNVYKGNKTQLDILHEFQADYSSKNALWWYTRESFLYKMLNKALRVQNIDVLFLFRFFIRDIHRELERHQCQSPICVYRGQILSNDELKNLRKSIGELISINSFFSTTTSRQQAIGFLASSDKSDDLHRVLFEIDADPRMGVTRPFANISSYSDSGYESEVLFMIGSIFRLRDIRRNNDQFWIIRLTLCGNDEHDLKSLFECMKKEYGGDDDETTLLNFGRVLRRMGKSDSAEKFYRRLLNELPPDDLSLPGLYYSLGLVLQDKKELDSSLEYLQKSLELLIQSAPEDYRKIFSPVKVHVWVEIDEPVSQSGIDTFIGSFQHNAIIHVPANVKGIDTLVITKHSSTLALVNIHLVIPYGGHVCAFGNDDVKFDYDQSNNRLVYEPCKLYISELQGKLILHDPTNYCPICNNIGVFDGLVFEPGSPSGSIDDFIGTFRHSSINGGQDTAVIVKQTSTTALLSLSGILPGGRNCSLNTIKVEYVPNTIPSRLSANGYVDCAVYFTPEQDGKLLLHDPTFNCARNNCGVFELWEGSVFQRD
ncbi:unnamed protein product [Rotaria sp. Silwood1]|nr:unnamed protein product [Rotaria sp. Silwood1]